MTPPPVKIRNLTVNPPLWLAPMAGLTHTALRRVIVAQGGAGCLTTEMLSAKRLKSENLHLSPFLIRHPDEKPLSFQILTALPQDAASAAEKLTALGADAIDINCGCPAPDVRRMGGGSRLMEKVECAAALLGAVRGATGLPVTVKFRLGETLDEGRLKEFALMCQSEGADLVTVHGRLRGEPYGRKPRWDWVGKVKGWLKIPVVANGSIFSVEDARECLRLSGADGLMIGRGAAQKPWLFREIAREVYGKDFSTREPDKPVLYGLFCRLVAENFPPERKQGRLKEFTHYFAKNYPFGHTLASKVQAAPSFEEAVLRAEEFFLKSEAGFTGWEKK